MHQKKFELQIGKDTNNGLSSDLNITVPTHLVHQSHQSQSQSTPPPLPPLPSATQHSPTQQKPSHLHIKIPPFSSNFSNYHEPICQNSSKNKSLFSSPHKRPMMSQSSSLSRSPTLFALHHNVNQDDVPVQAPLPLQPHHFNKKLAVLKSDSSNHQSYLCSPSFHVLLATKRITLRFIHHSCHASWFRVHLKVFILLSLPGVYFFTSTHHWPFLLHFLYLLAFSAFIVVSLNLALPRFPSVRLFLEKTLCIKLKSLAPPPKHHHSPPVVWSIGSKPKSEKRQNSGSWVQVYSNGDVYEGEFYKGKCSGSGVYYYHLSGRYEGDWVDEKYDGYGVETWAKGSRYRGQYRQGLRHGVGLYRSYTGDVYSGEWCNGQCHGCGFLTCEDGSSYIGEFKWGVKHGLGRYHFRNGDTYAGEYFADKMHGFGVYNFANGHRYEGAWHEGRRQGFGTYTFRNGETQSGHWENGILNASSIQGILNGSSVALDNSKVLHAVQEARRAAEKAAELPNTEERVKRAVAAANKAANAARVAAVKAVQNQMPQNNNNVNVPKPVCESQ
ncbi:uncharacterized protein LOC113779042 [Coffea eugenioides]|uniref:uncharacterized protein LOC113779042 n=1 Tax=Coffea eugenioides TaxID=49369 RepID=UPI000F604F3F|nr:uncharacterized protein LOC113779042 [Coffea eugenioides]